MNHKNQRTDCEASRRERTKAEKRKKISIIKYDSRSGSGFSEESSVGLSAMFDFNFGVRRSFNEFRSLNPLSRKCEHSARQRVEFWRQPNQTFLEVWRTWKTTKKSHSNRLTIVCRRSDVTESQPRTRRHHDKKNLRPYLNIYCLLFYLQKSTDYNKFHFKINLPSRHPPGFHFITTKYEESLMKMCWGMPRRCNEWMDWNFLSINRNYWSGAFFLFCCCSLLRELSWHGKSDFFPLLRYQSPTAFCTYHFLCLRSRFVKSLLSER